MPLEPDEGFAKYLESSAWMLSDAGTLFETQQGTSRNPLRNRLFPSPDGGHSVEVSIPGLGTVRQTCRGVRLFSPAHMCPCMSAAMGVLQRVRWRARTVWLTSKHAVTHAHAHARVRAGDLHGEKQDAQAPVRLQGRVGGQDGARPRRPHPSFLRRQQAVGHPDRCCPGRAPVSQLLHVRRRRHPLAS